MSDNINPDSVEQTLTKRVRCDYELLHQDIMKLRKQNVLNELEILKITGKSVIFENQEIIASKVVTALKNRKIINIMVLSKTQSGKTGSMCATIKQYLEDTNNLIPIENIYIITGLSSCEWKEQTKERMPESIQSRVFHGSELPKTFVDEIKYKKNILIMMDEIQVAAKKGQTIYKTFDNSGLLNKSKLYKNDIKIIEYTATPDGTIYDLMGWNDSSTKILAEVGDGYTSSFDLLQMKRVKQYKELCGYDEKSKKIDEEVFENIREIKNDIDKYSIALYHIIRTKNEFKQDLTIQNFKEIFNNDNYDYIKYDRESDIEDINKTLIIKPKRHTFIFIKEMLRCAKTLKKTFIGILYDRYSKNPDDTTIIQGLVGRDTGYDNNGISICYTNIDSIIRYEKLWNSNFEDKTIKWNSKTTKYTNGILSGKNTFNDPNNYQINSLETIENDDDDNEPEPIIRKFKSQEEVTEAYLEEPNGIGNHMARNLIEKKENKKIKNIDKLSIQKDKKQLFIYKITFDDDTVKEIDEKTYKQFRGRGPNKHPGPNENGFYVDTNVKYVLSTVDLFNKRKDWIKKQERPYRVRPCYQNVNDNTTLEWWVIYY